MSIWTGDNSSEWSWKDSGELSDIHEMACILADAFGDTCACNFNGIDEWLPLYCDYADTCCPHPTGVACWEQYLKHRHNMNKTDVVSTAK